MIDKLKQSPLFAGISDADIERCIQCSGAEIITYEKDEMVFLQHDAPRRVLVLLEGAVVVYNDSVSGKRSIIATLDHAGELFGEVFVFLNKQSYDHHAQAMAATQILHMPREFLFQTYGETADYHAKLISNMLTILAQKAYYLNRKLQIVSASTLRQKIAKVLLLNALPDGKVALPMNREELADFLNTARPSLSRELMRMQSEGLIKIQKKQMVIIDFETLQNI